jgi:type IV pilus assembly protein PilM
MVELMSHDDHGEILSWAIEPLKDGNVKPALSNILRQVKFLTKSPVTALFGKGTLIRYIDMPRMPFLDLKSSLSIEADKYFPFPAEQIYTDCYILDPKAKENKMPVLVAAAKRELVNARIDLLTGLGLQADFIGINSMAIANIVHTLGWQGPTAEVLADPVSTQAVAILDMGEVVSNLTILVNRSPRFTRDIFVGGRDITRSAGNALGLSLTEAERLKCQPGDQLAQVLSASEAGIMNLISEIRLSFDYFVTEKNVPISLLLLTGGASLLQGVDALFANHLEMKVAIWNPVELFSLAEGVSKEEIDRQAGKLGVALGLALYG